MFSEKKNSWWGMPLSTPLQQGPVGSKFHIEEVVSHQPFFFEKTRLNDLSHSIKIWTDFYFVLS